MYLINMNNLKKIILLLVLLAIIIILVVISTTKEKNVSQKSWWPNDFTNVALSEIHLNEYSQFNPDRCTNGIMGRLVTFSQVDYICRPENKPTINQGIFGYTTFYTEISSRPDKYKEIEGVGHGTFFEGKIVTISQYNRKDQSLKEVARITTNSDENGFFEIELPVGEYIVFSNQALDTIQKRIGRYLDDQGHFDIEKAETQYLQISIININENEVKEAVHGLHKTFLAE